MATQPLNNDSVRVDADGTVWRVRPPATRPVEPPRDGSSAIDPVQALIDLGEAPEQAAVGLADQLLAWITPRPRNPTILTQSRIAPLLGMAAELLSQAAGSTSDIVGLGATALAQELHMQRTLADRRATLIKGDE